jgi:hypothetical protein
MTDRERAEKWMRANVIESDAPGGDDVGSLAAEFEAVRLPLEQRIVELESAMQAASCDMADTRNALLGVERVLGGRQVNLCAALSGLKLK